MTISFCTECFLGLFWKFFFCLHKNGGAKKDKVWLAFDKMYDLDFPSAPRVADKKCLRNFNALSGPA
jgi:hypothetical protein